MTRNIIKRGYTLIELIVVLGMLSIIMAIIYPNLMLYHNKRADADLQCTVEEIIQFINAGKSYARSTKGISNSNIMIKFSNEKIIMNKEIKTVKSIQVPNTIKKIVLSDGINSLEINEFGEIRKAKSINIYDFRGNYETITIKVGTSYVSRKK